MPQLSASIPVEVTDQTIIQRYLRLFASIGCHGLQAFWRNGFHTRLDQWIECVGRAGLAFDSVHGSFGAELDLSNPDLQVRSLALATHEKDAEIAVALGGPIVVVHPSCKIPAEAGLQREDREKWGAAVDESREPSLIDALEQLAGIGEEVDCLFVIENIPSNLWYGHNAPRLAEKIRSIGSPFVRMCFDTGHAHVESGRFGSVASQFSRCVDVVSYMHVHDNDGKSDAHLVPGDGSIDWEGLSAALRDAPDELICMIERFDSIDKMERLLGPPEVRHRLHRILRIG